MRSLKALTLRPACSTLPRMKNWPLMLLIAVFVIGMLYLGMKAQPPQY
jgi:hypothetical protein